MATNSTNGVAGSAPRKRASKTSKTSRAKAKGPDLLGRFGPYLMLRRKRKNLSIRGFAKRAGIPHTNVFQYERLRKDPRLTELAQLAQAFRESLATFLEPLL